MASTKPATAAVETYRFEPDSGIPNNPALPLLVYRGVLPLAGDAPATCEKLFDSHDWPAAWRNGVYPYHHFHSTAHEVLGIVSGEAKVRFGGEGGQTVAVRAGDVVVIPAGVGHKSESASPDLLVIGGYPAGQNPDMNRAKPDRGAGLRDKVRAVPTPQSDPVYGRDGPLVKEWRSRP